MIPKPDKSSKRREKRSTGDSAVPYPIEEKPWSHWGRNRIQVIQKVWKKHRYFCRKIKSVNSYEISKARISQDLFEDYQSWWSSLGSQKQDMLWPAQKTSKKSNQLTFRIVLKINTRGLFKLKVFTQKKIKLFPFEWNHYNPEKKFETAEKNWMLFPAVFAYLQTRKRTCCKCIIRPKLSKL